jgi:serine phosphatase RsbU (regulator of sigma subunit)
METPENKLYAERWQDELRSLMVKSATKSWPLTGICIAVFIFVEIYHRSDADYIRPFYIMYMGGSALVLTAHLLRKKIRYPYVVSAFGTSILVPMICIVAACITVPENVYSYFLMTSVVIVVRGLLYCQKVTTLALIAACTHTTILVTTLIFRDEPYFSLPNILSTNIIQLFLILFSLSGTASRYKLQRDNFMNSLQLANFNRSMAEKNKDITDSINYARRIQRSLLPQNHYLRSNLGEHCIFYRPKDIVSGDFYWASRLQNGDFAVVVGDSTGHGVPGAIMSMLNIASLNEVQNNAFINSPAKVLDHARKRITEHLNNHDHDDGAKDGMDAVVVCIDKDFRHVTYSAANNSLWLIRQGEIQQLKGDKMSVGKDADRTLSFTEKTIPLEKNDLLFMFTDGYTDQFGGERGKKFMIKRFREIMQTMAHLPLEELNQKLTSQFDEWKGAHEQTDDVLVFAMRVN